MRIGLVRSKLALQSVHLYVCVAGRGKRTTGSTLGERAARTAADPHAGQDRAPHTRPTGSSISEGLNGKRRSGVSACARQTAAFGAMGK